MNFAFTSRRARLAVLVAASSTLAALGACGGGGGDSSLPPATVSAASVAATRFDGTAFIQVSGTNLDKNLDVVSNECTSITRLTAAPYVSTDTTAYYSCRVMRLSGTVGFRQHSDGAVLKTATFTVPAPQVQMTFAGAVTGTVLVDLAADKVPGTVANFLEYVNATAHLYQGTIIHRVVRPSAMNGNLSIIQGGGYGPASTTTLGAHITTFAPIPLEIDPTLHNTAGTIAMARGDLPNSATSEYYFNVQDNLALDNAYAVFGALHSSTDVATLLAIQGAPCTPYPGDFVNQSCLPIPNVVLQGVVQTQ